MRLVLCTSAALLLAVSVSYAQQVPQSDSSVIDADGTAHVTRVVPVPATLSPEAQAVLRRQISDAAVPQTLQQRRERTDAWQLGAGEASRKVYPVDEQTSSIAGVPVRIFTPQDAQPMHPQSVLINLHGGGFNSDSGSFTESIPICNLTHTRVVSVLYRLAPENPFPASVDDVVAVYRELLKSYRPAHIAIYGTSAGAILTGEVAVRFKQLGLPQPAALGIFSATGDFARAGDSTALFSLQGLAGHLEPPSGKPDIREYSAKTDPRDPVLSPVYADLHGLPPTLFLTSTRDMLLSGTVNLQRRFLEDGVDTRMVVFDGLAHAFWNDVALPESRETYRIIADFMAQHVNR
ncbi:MAG: alpha/beta hydrolase fold domain-containing protein [Acidobacteriota bacterium]|nr:alpha/beta hydrolase fold domain-containing protein [Acidobacteriota bacterium]